MLAKQLIWASTTPDAKNTAYNIVNGDIFRWKWLWPRIAEWFDIEYEGYPGSIRPLEEEMKNDKHVWEKSSEDYGRAIDNLDELASPWHTELDLSRPIEVMTDMKNSRIRGFSEFQSTEESFINLFKLLQAEKIIPQEKIKCEKNCLMQRELSLPCNI